MPTTVGALLGPYEIVAPLGKGGMGEVYRARDTKLNRDVATKARSVRGTNIDPLDLAFSPDSQSIAFLAPAIVRGDTASGGGIWPRLVTKAEANK